jgi:hypothetical protein
VAYCTYLELDGKDSKAGFAGVARRLADAGCTLTKERWRQILRLRKSRNSGLEPVVRLAIGRASGRE